MGGFPVQPFTKDGEERGVVCKGLSVNEYGNRELGGRLE
jgi:hypothetical protein